MATGIISMHLEKFYFIFFASTSIVSDAMISLKKHGYIMTYLKIVDQNVTGTATFLR